MAQARPEALQRRVLLQMADEHARRSRSDRLITLAVLVVMLLASRLLVPDPAGYGTHTRLLMPPCIFKTLTGVPCPLCGMTTAFAHASRGNLIAAFEAHPLGPTVFTGVALGIVLIALSFVPSLALLRQWLECLQGAAFWKWVLILFVLAWPIHIYLELMRF